MWLVELGVCVPELAAAAPWQISSPPELRFKVVVIIQCIDAFVMPSSDYTSTVGGGLKLKGAKDAGVKKHKKKKPKGEANDSKTERSTERIESDAESGALQKALANEEEGEVKGSDVPGKKEARGDGKTETQRKHEEMRRKRVCATSSAC